MSDQHRLWTGAVASILAFAAAGQANAADFTVGLGAGFAPDYEGSDDYEAVPAWLLSADNLYHPDTYIALTGPVLRSNFVPHPHFRAGLSGQWVPERDHIDDNTVEDLSGGDSALLLGALIGWDFIADEAVSLTAALDARYDLANGDGYILSPRLIYATSWPESKFSFGAELFTNWASNEYMSEHFGIDAADAARTGLQSHDADADFKDAGLAVNVNYRFTDTVSATALGGYARLFGDAGDSPIVEDRGDENQFFIGATVNYHF